MHIEDFRLAVYHAQYQGAFTFLMNPSARSQAQQQVAKARCMRVETE